MVIKTFLPLLVTALFLTGCFSVKSYVDPSFSTATYEDIVPTLGTFRAKVKVEFQRDGELYERANEELKRAVENALISTGIIIPDVEAADVTMTVVVNNIPESGAAAKGFGVGLTYGLAGTSVIDNYDVSIAYKEPSRLEGSKQYQHAIRTTLGFDNGQVPFLGKVEATTTADAFATMVEQVIVNFVADMQGEGYLTLVPQNEHGIVTEVEYTSTGEKYTESIETPVVDSESNFGGEKSAFDYYGQAEEEINTQSYDKNLWDKALVETGGDQTKRKARYIELRANQLYSEKYGSLSPLEQSEVNSRVELKFDISGNYVSDIEKIEVQQLKATDSSSSPEGQPLAYPNLSGIYVSEITSNRTAYFAIENQKPILKLEQHGNKITAFDSRNNTTITGVLKGNVIYFDVLPGGNTPLSRASGQWTIKNEGDRFEGTWKAYGYPWGGNWNLRKRENNGVELYTVETGLNQPFRIRESEKLFDMIFAPPNNQNVVFHIHGRGKDFDKQFDPSMIPYTEASSNTRFVLIHWLSWGESRMRPYRHARNSSMGLSDFLFAFNEYKSRKPSYVGDRNITLLAHSMGSIPLKIFMEELYEKRALQRGLLSSVILSSADVPIAGHRKWVEKIDFSDNIHIIQNRNDLVLSLSSFFDKNTPGGEGPKLGRGFDTATYTHIEDLANNAHYLDVTRSASLGHRPFKMSSYPTDANATRLFNLLLNGQGFDFPDPTIGLYQRPELSPVFYFSSSNGLQDKPSVETKEDQAKRMARYIELRAKQFYSEEQRRPEIVQFNTSENVYSKIGDWRPAKGEWKTIWRVSSGVINARLKIIDDTRVTYGYKSGRIFFYSIDKHGKWEGYWVEDTGSKACANILRDGSSHWGKVIFQFNDNYTSFKGTWDYCGQGIKRYWKGYR